MRLLFLITLIAVFSPFAAAQPLDTILFGGKIIDGSGNPWYRSDVGIVGTRIVAIGDLTDVPAQHRIDVTGLYVLPGFIDLHSHAVDVAWEGQGLDSEDRARRAAPNLVSQGITTVVVNHDGRSPVDIRDQRTLLEERGIGLNALLMLGHGSLRRAVMGDDFQRPASHAEVDSMRALVRRGMREGAVGLSAGLEYVPGRWSETDEVVAMVDEIVPFGGVYISHQRSEGADPMWYWPSVDSAGPPTLIDAVLETIEIGERTGATVVASHLKAKGAHYWGTSAAAIRLIGAARDRGVSVWGDQYPYTTSGSDGSTVLLPSWSIAGPRSEENPDYAERLARILSDPQRAAALRLDVRHEIRRRGGADRVLVLEYPDSSFVGLSLNEVSARLNRDPVEAAIWLQLNGEVDRRGGGRLRGFSMDEQDVDAYAAMPWMVTASDAGIALPDDGLVHPRYYGTFPRKIRRYAIERGVLSVPDAVRSATSLPALILGLKDRGLVREQFIADLTVVDLGRIADQATAFDPHLTSDGIVHVFLGGAPIFSDGVATGELVGKVLSRK